MNESEAMPTQAYSAPPIPSLKIIAIASSAGGLNALSILLANLPAGLPATVIIVQHLDPQHPSMLAAILNQRTPLPVKEAEDGEYLHSGTVYIAPPNHHLLINPNNTIGLTQSKLVHFVRPSADLLFESVAAIYQTNAIAVVLTGSGSDGSMGVTAIKAMGGIVIAQNEETAEFFGMPDAAIKTECVDLVLPLEEIAPNLAKLVTESPTKMSSASPDTSFENLLAYLKKTRGFDFAGYKPATLMRRINKRIALLGLEGFGTYQDYLEVHPEEFAHLFDTILINVTSFFRDTAAWEALQHKILPQLIEGKAPKDTIRIWCAGCASGEEPYTLAMLMSEVLGVRAFQQQVKIYATDLDEQALRHARQAIYTTENLKAVPEDLREQYFEPVGNRFAFRSDLRRSIIFGRHDLLQDSPISHLDLLVCRNTLMYFNREAQTRILNRFHFALNDKGYLFLGKAEILLTQGHLFTPEILPSRIFSKVVRPSSNNPAELFAFQPNPPELKSSELQLRLLQLAIEASPIAQIIIGINGNLLMLNRQAIEQFGLSRNDLNRPFRDLELSYRPTDLRSPIERAYSERHPILISDIEHLLQDNQVQTLQIHVAPLIDAADHMLGVSVTIEDVSQSRQLERELQHRNKELEIAYEELQSTNEELETTNEELQSTVEELETTNEELHSTNEEMETMNEELQSTNEELETINNELRDRTKALDDANTFLESILTGLRIGLIAIDRDFTIVAWNRRSEDLWGLRSDEVVGQPLLSLDIGLPVEQLGSPIRAILNGKMTSHELTLEAMNRRGQTINCRVNCTLRHSIDSQVGVILLMEEENEQKAL